MFIILLLFIYGLMHPLLISSSTRNSLLLFSTYILPSLFFYIFILDILFKMKSLNKATNGLFNIFKIFKIRSNYSVLIILFSFFVGNPTNAKNVIDLLDENKINKNEANYLLCTTHFVSIGFSITFVGIILKNYLLCIVPITANIISNLILMILNKNEGQRKKEEIVNVKYDFSSSFTKTINVLIMICAVTLFSGILIDILLELKFPKIFLGFIEITRGIKELNNLDIRLFISFISAFLSFGGVSIHLQIYNIIRNKLNYKKFLFNRILASIFSFIICYEIYFLINLKI